MRGRWRVRMDGCLVRSVLLLRTQKPTHALLIPRGQVLRVLQAREEFFDVVISPGVEQHRVVYVIRRLLPRVEDHLLPCVIWVQCRDHALDRIVKEHGTHSDLDVELEVMRVGEERLVLADRFALVIKDRPTAADPTRIHNRTIFNHCPGLGLNLLLDFAAKAIRVGKTDLNLALLPWLQFTDMSLARNGGSEGRLAQPFEAIKIINKTSCSFA